MRYFVTSGYIAVPYLGCSNSTLGWVPTQMNIKGYEVHLLSVCFVSCKISQNEQFATTYME